MRIGIDARFFGSRAKGLGRYTQKLIEELELVDNQNDYVIFLREENFDEYQPHSSHFKKILADWRWYSLAEQLFFPWQIYRQKIDLMHFAHFNAPLFYRRPLIVTIHDLILQRWPTHKKNVLSRIKYFFKSLGYKIIIRSVLGRAQKIIAVSQFVKDDIVRSFSVAEEKIEVIYEGTSRHLSDFQPPLSSLAKYKINPPYLLYVGNAYPHKNLARLAEAFKLLRDGKYRDLQLVLVGSEDYFYRKIKKENCDSNGTCFGGGVIFTGYVPDEELGSLYQDASLYVFPSLCEGFGLPPLEAMARGVPVAAARATCLPEILGQAAHYFNGENLQDIAAKIGEVLGDDVLRQQLVRQGFEQIKKYSWRKMAEETGRVYGNARLNR